LLKSPVTYECSSKNPQFRNIFKSTDLTDVVQLSVFVRSVTDEFEIIEDLLDVMSIKEITSADNTFGEIVTVMNTYNLNLDTMIDFTSDTAAAVIGKKWSCRKIKN